jgi:hypothetical protein
MHFNEEQIAFNFEMGLAIQQWAHVEFALSAIVGTVFKGRSTTPAVIGYRSIENFRSKLQYVDSVLKNKRLPKKLMADWALLEDRIRRASKKRNKLVHYWVYNDPDGQPSGRRRMLLSLRPTPNNKGGNQKYRGAVFLRDIVSYRLEFVALMKALENFCARLSKRPEHFPKSQEQPKDPPTIAQLRREIYALASTPPRP